MKLVHSLLCYVGMNTLSTRSLSSLISPLMLAGVLLVLTPIFAVMTLDRMENSNPISLTSSWPRGFSDPDL